MSVPVDITGEFQGNRSLATVPDRHYRIRGLLSIATGGQRRRTAFLDQRRRLRQRTFADHHRRQLDELAGSRGHAMILAAYTIGLRVVRAANREKSRSAVHNSDTRLCRQSAAMRASCTWPPVTFEALSSASSTSQ